MTCGKRSNAYGFDSFGESSLFPRLLSQRQRTSDALLSIIAQPCILSLWDSDVES
uniref:Uncharacterized protein n=1 Tax=Lepeophtheirus salmonis TaxID=72036 RepID=A0A0K2U1H9_LEPSM